MERKAVSVITLTLLLTGMMLTLAFKIELVFAVEYPAIYVDPPFIVDSTLTPGKNFTVSIKTNYAGDNITQYQFHLSFNPNVLHGVNVTNGDLITTDVDPLAQFIPGNFNNASGELGLTAALFFSFSDPEPMTSGPGTLANVTFTVVGYGTSNITFGSQTELRGPKVGEQPRYIIPVTLQHGYFNNVATGGDVAVTNVTLSDNEAYWTWTIQVNVAVKNNGTEPASFNVTAYFSNSPTWYEIGTQTVTNLTASENITLTFNWVLSGLPEDKNFTVKANATLLDGVDTNPVDNEKVDGQVKVRRWGDVDGNDVINILDLKKVKLAYTGIIDEPFADLDGDGPLITILDVKLSWLICSGGYPG